MKKLSNEDIEKRIKEKLSPHKYYFDLNQISGLNSEISVSCKEHGEFVTTPYKIIYHNSKCPFCKNNKIGISKSLTRQEFIEKAKKIHGNKYDYSLVEYYNNKTKVKIICKSCGNVFEQIPGNHLNGEGCPFCNK